MLAVLCSFIIFLVLSACRIFRKDKLFFTFYFSTVIYSLIPFLARLYDNSFVSIVSRIYLKHPDTTLLSYLCFVYANFFFLYLFFELILCGWLKRCLHEWSFKDNGFWQVTCFVFSKNNLNYKKNIFFVLISLLILFLGINLFLNFDKLSYFNQAVFKNNIIWYFAIQLSLFVIGNNIILVFFSKKFTIPNQIIILLTFVLGIIVTITLFKIGNRGIIFPFLTGTMCLVLINFSFTDLKKLMQLIVLVFFIIALSQLIRGNRGDSKKIENIKFDAVNVVGFFSLSSLLFQDYTACGSSLMYTIENEIVDPLFFFKSTMGNGIFFLNYPSIAEFISQKIVPEGGVGVGALIFNDGYILCGWFGAIMLPLTIVLSYRIHYSLFLNKGDTEYKNFIIFILGTLFTLSLTRGQTYLLFKDLYMYLPFCVWVFIYSRGYSCRLILMSTNKSKMALKF